MKNKIKVSDVYPGRLNEVTSGRISVAKFVEELNQIITEKVQPQPIDKLFDLNDDTVVWVKLIDGTKEVGYYYSTQKLLELHQDLMNKHHATHIIESFLIAEVPKF